MKRFALTLALFAATLLASPATATWEIIPSGTTADLHDVHAFLGTWIVGDGGTLLRSDDNGLSWEDRQSGTTADLHDAHMPSSTNLWLAGFSGTVLLSVDQGTSWIPRGTGDASANLRTIFSRSSGIAFAAGEHGKVFYSDNVGVDWFARPVGIDVDLHTGIAPAIGGLRGIVAGAGGHLFSTEDAGVTWASVVTGTTHDIHAMIGGPGNSIVAFGAGGVILRSDDFGATWTRMPSSVTTTLYGASTSGASSFYMIACGAGGTLIKSTDGGLSWGRLVSPTDIDLHDIHGFDNNNWVACGVGGLIIRTADGGGNVVAVGDLPAVTADAELRPAYPNPFNPQTNLRFRLDAPGAVQLAVYAVDGRLVRTLASGRRDAGWHVVAWDGRDDAGSSLPSGVYLARFSGAGQVLHQRMQLVK